MVNVVSQLTIYSSNDEGATSVINTNRRVLQPRNLNTEPIVQNKTSKPKSDPIKTRLTTDSKVSLGEENDNAWPSLDKESRTPSLESEMEEPLPDIFRQRSDLDEDDADNDMFMLKRANPVYDSDDDEFMTSPPKRQRMSGPTVLHWGEQLSESDEFSLSHLSAP